MSLVGTHPTCFLNNPFIQCFDFMLWAPCFCRLMEMMWRLLQGEGPALKDMLESGVLEPYLVKHWGIKLATNAAITVLRVDQVRTHTKKCDIPLSIYDKKNNSFNSICPIAADYICSILEK